MRKRESFLLLCVFLVAYLLILSTFEYDEEKIPRLVQDAYAANHAYCVLVGDCK